MTEKTEHPVDQPPEQEPEHGHEHRLMVYSSSLEEGREPPVKRWKDASKVEEIKFDSSRLDKLPFHLLGAV